MYERGGNTKQYQQTPWTLGFPAPNVEQLTLPPGPKKNRRNCQAQFKSKWSEQCEKQQERTFSSASRLGDVVIQGSFAVAITKM